MGTSSAIFFLIFTTISSVFIAAPCHSKFPRLLLLQALTIFPNLCILNLLRTSMARQAVSSSWYMFSLGLPVLKPFPCVPFHLQRHNLWSWLTGNLMDSSFPYLTWCLETLRKLVIKNMRQSSHLNEAVFSPMDILSSLPSFRWCVCIDSSVGPRLCSAALQAWFCARMWVLPISVKNTFGLLKITLSVDVGPTDNVTVLIQPI